jgi:hypothetical protein
MKKNIASLIGGAAMLAAATVGLTAGAAPASAAPTQNGAKLFVAQDPANPGQMLVSVHGTFPMNGHDAHGFINNLNTGSVPGGMRYEIFADDDGSGDRTATLNRWFGGAGVSGEGHLYATDTGIHYHHGYSVPKADLNEDDAFYNDIDEVYARATFVDGDGGNRRQISNVVTQQF